MIVMPSIVLSDIVRSGLRKRPTNAVASPDITQSRICLRNFLFNLIVMAYFLYEGHGCGADTSSGPACGAWHKHRRIGRRGPLCAGRAGFAFGWRH
jgi:hypothetical protein